MANSHIVTKQERRSAMNKVALITGVGPGTGSAIARRFHEGGYRIAALARDAGRLEELSRNLPGLLPIVCDVEDRSAVERAHAQTVAHLGPVDVLIHNAVRGTRGDVLQVDVADLERNFSINVTSLLQLTQLVAPHMISRSEGAIMITGNTAARRGKSFFAAFAPTKAAQRILAESMARRLGPDGVHVAYFVIDAVIDVPWTRKAFADKPDAFFTKPAAIADSIWHVAHQDRSAWSFDVDLRPFGETW
jgi:NAD(P)-dependent dehydrogenase (short-subunit alcohol dehydrogenase family)